MKRLVLMLTLALSTLCGVVMALGERLVVMQVPSSVVLAEAERVIVLDRVSTLATDTFYRDQLDEDGKAAYDALFSGAYQHQRSFDIIIPSTDSIEAALHAVVADHPDFFWLDGSCAYQGLLLGGTHIDLGYTMDEAYIAEAQQRIDTATDAYLSALPVQASAYEKVQAAFEWVVNNTDYSFDTDQSQNLSSVFVEHKSVCAGYSKAFQYLLRHAGVPCVYIRGTIEPDGIDHAWNLVDIDGTLTYVDVTWGDPTYTGAGGEEIVGNMSYDYLCLTTAEMQRTGHIPANASTLPICDSSIHDYYRINDLLFDTFDQTVIDDAFRRAFDSDETGLAMKFASDDAYMQAMDALANRSLLRGTFFDLASAAQGTTRVSYKTTHDDNLRILKIFW